MGKIFLTNPPHSPVENLCPLFIPTIYVTELSTEQVTPTNRRVSKWSISFC